VFAVHAEPPLAENEEWAVLWDPYSGQIFYNNKKTGSSMYRFNPILHMWFRESCFACHGSSPISISFAFQNGLFDHNKKIFQTFMVMLLFKLGLGCM
jgi:hypothetical protein